MSQVASDSLLWIKNELDHTLARARQALEAYVEHPDGDEALGQCLELLHQVQGTLRIVEVYGAAMLAEEMESVVRGLRSGELPRSDAAFEVLMRAMLQLPDYLERVIGGRRDMPLALLSLLNDLRAVRGQPLLSESALFAYNLAGRSASVVGRAPSTRAVDIKNLAGKLRPKFQMALLGWYKGDQAEKHLATLADTAERLEQAATTPAVFELWWIVGGVIEGLREGGIQADVSLKQLLGQVDRQIKRLMDQGEAPVAGDSAKELVNNLLYYVGRATSHGKRITAIKESFKLGELLPGEDEVDETREKISGPNINLMRTVSGAIKEDITRIKDTLDIFVRTRKTDVAELALLDALLKKVGDTLGVLGLPELRGTLEAERGHLKKILDGQRAPDEAALMEMASGIVGVEDQLDTAMVGLVAPLGGGTAGEAGGARSELREVQNAVIRESIINLAHIKEAIVEFVNDPARLDSLQPLPQRIREIQASLRFLQLDRVVVVLESVRQYIRQRLLGAQGLPAQNELDRMADAIVSVEFYLEAIQQGRGNPVSMLDNAEACVTTLGFPVNREYRDDGAEPVVDGMVSTAGLVSSVMESENIVIEPAGTVAIENIAATPAETPALLSPLANQVSDQPVEAPTAQITPPPVKTPGKSAQPTAQGPAVVPLGEVDPEILEIFLEEAQEEMQSLRENFPRWRSNPADREALTTVRRSLHTLKGSGRMVGARLIGEFAWSFENMLNRVIDQTIEPTDGMFSLMERAISALPELVEQLEVGSAPHTDIQPLMDAAAAFSRGEQPPLPLVPADTETSVIEPAKAGPRKRKHPSPPVDDLSMAAAAGTDPQLHGIFTREAEGHLGVLAAFLEQVRLKADNCVPDENLVRAMHTLHGSASMAGITGMATLMEPVQRYLMDVSARDEPVPESGLTTLADVLISARQMLKAINADEDIPQADAALLKRLGAQLQSAAPVEGPGVTTIRRAAIPRAQQSLRYVQLSDLKDFDPDLAAIFFEEATELLESTDGTLHQWSQKRNDPELVMQLQRNLHTLKGGARMAGLTPMGDLSHELESVFTDVVDGRIAVSTELVALLNRSVDRLHRMLEQSYSNKPIVDASDLVADLRHLHGHTVDTELEPESVVDRFETVPAPASPAPVIEPPSHPAETGASGEIEEETAAAEAALGGSADRRTGSRIQHELIRVRADLLESALNYAGEVGIYRSRLEQQVHSINFNLGELEQTVVRLRDQLRKLEIETEAQILHQFQQEGGNREHPEFDPLELDRYSLLQQLSRALGESTGDLVSLQALLLNQAREAETLLLQQSRVTTELQDGLMRTRMVPFSRHAQRLRRIVRQTADESHKQVDLKLLGAEGEMDRQVLERVLAPLEHMLRNSVVHGIEVPEQRKQRKKPSMGSITVTLSREGSEVVMEVADDGGGLDLRAIRRKAEEMGLILPDAKPGEREVMSYILEPGFSTAEKITQTAGRGVGMDVVASEIKQLGGSLRIDSVAGQGAKFVIRLPFTLAITQALLVTVADQAYAIPLPSIEGIARITRAELERLMASESPAYLYGGRPYELQHLSVLLGIGAPQFPDELVTVPLLLVRTTGANIALITEGMQGSREVVVKSVGPQVGSIRGISGATILGDGSILLILDVTALTRNVAQTIGTGIEVLAREAPKEDSRIFAMVVDDSITVRRVTQRLLERYGMRVLTAKDGVDALASLQENQPDVMLLDIEMPRMDGYELAQHMRNDERFKSIPIIMITSRTGEKHRNRAMEIGVNKYLGKPYQETELLENIQELVGRFHPQRTRWE